MVEEEEVVMVLEILRQLAHHKVMMEEQVEVLIMHQVQEVVVELVLLVL